MNASNSVTFRHRDLVPFWFCLAVVIAILVVEFSLLPFAAFIATEGRGVELASAVALILTVPMFFFATDGTIPKGLGYVPILLAALAMRELDFDKRFLEEGVLQARLYSGSAPLSHKLIGLAVLAVLVTALWHLARRGIPSWFRAFKERQGWAIVIAIAILSLTVAKNLDGIARKLAPYGIEISERMSVIYTNIEEGLELLFAVLLALTLSLWAIRRKGS